MRTINYIISVFLCSVCLCVITLVNSSAFNLSDSSSAEFPSDVHFELENYPMHNNVNSSSHYFSNFVVFNNYTKQAYYCEVVAECSSNCFGSAVFPFIDFIDCRGFKTSVSVPFYTYLGIGFSHDPSLYLGFLPNIYIYDTSGNLVNSETDIGISSYAPTDTNDFFVSFLYLASSNFPNDSFGSYAADYLFCDFWLPISVLNYPHGDFGTTILYGNGFNDRGLCTFSSDLNHEPTFLKSLSINDTVIYGGVSSPTISNGSLTNPDGDVVYNFDFGLEDIPNNSINTYDDVNENLPSINESDFNSILDNLKYSNNAIKFVYDTVESIFSNTKILGVTLAIMSVSLIALILNKRV